MYGLFTLAQLHFGHTDISSFITAGDFFVSAQKTPSEIFVLKNSHGYDGEFYYRLALDPFTNQRENFGVRLDNPPFRQQRIGYPILVWALSLGNKAAVPPLMVMVNLVSLCGVAFFAALIAKGYGRSILWGCVMAAYPGFVMSYSRDLAEIVTVFWILAGIYALQNRLALLAAILFTVATFCRETSLLVPAGAGVYFLLSYIRKERNLKLYPWHLMLMPLFFHVVWIKFISMHWGQPAISGGVQDIGLPFVGMSAFLSKNIAYHSLLSRVNIFFFVFCGVTLGFSATALKKSRADTYIKISWALYAFLLILLSDVIWLTFGEFTRAFTEAFLLSFCIIVGRVFDKQWIGLFYSAYVIFSWLVMANYFLGFLGQLSSTIILIFSRLIN